MNELIESIDKAIKELKLAIVKKELEITSTIAQMEHHKEKLKSERGTKEKMKIATIRYITRSQLDSKLHNRNMNKKSDLKKLNTQLSNLTIRRSTLKGELQRKGITIPDIEFEFEVPTINICTNCACPLDFDSNICVYCGKVFGEKRDSPQVPIVCTNCKSSIEGIIRYCPYCGTDLKDIIDS